MGECLLAEKIGLCSDCLPHAQATASHDCICDIDGITVVLESKDTPIGNRVDGDWKYFTQVATREHCVENCMAPSSQMDCIWSKGAEFFHEWCAGVPATLTFQMREVRAWFVYSRWSWWETGIYWCMCGSGKEWLCSSDWITILRADKLGIGGIAKPASPNTGRVLFFI